MRNKEYENMFDPLGLDKNKSDTQRLIENHAAQSAALRGDAPPASLGPNARRLYDRYATQKSVPPARRSSKNSVETTKKVGDVIERMGGDHNFDPKVFRKRRITILISILVVGALIWLSIVLRAYGI